MTCSVAIPECALYAPLWERAEDVCRERGWKLLRGTERQCETWMARGTSELALLTPLAYARDSYKTDYRIVPGPALALDGLTYAASIYLNARARVIERCAAPAADDFLPQLGAAVLSEKFDCELVLENLESPETPIEAALERYDAAIDYGFDERFPIALDVGDEWQDYAETPLPLAFWVCRPDDVPADVADAARAMAAERLPERETVWERIVQGATAHRQGALLWRWSDELEEGLRKTIELLFYRQLVPTISATKVWLRDSSHPLES